MRLGLRAAALTLLSGLLLLPGCGPPGLARGVWVAEKGPERYVLTFEHAVGLYSGSMHHIRDGRQVRQWGFAGTRTGESKLELSWGVNNSMIARVDLELDEIEATAYLRDGSEIEGVFRRRDAREVPGLAALSELPYRLRPPAAGSGWEVAAPAEVGLSEKHLQGTVRAITRGEAGLLNSLVIVRHGKLVLEEYFHGWGREDVHEMQSAAKSVASLLVGIARDRGAIGGVDTPVLEWFPERAAECGPGWEKVTLEHLLTMTAGLDRDPRETWRAPSPGPGALDDAFSYRVAHEPGSRYLYNNADVELLSSILLRATGVHADELAARVLFAPLGITAWDWEQGRTDGYPAMAGALQLRPLDMARIGQMVLDAGRWQGRQVVSEEWIAESTAPRVDPGPGSHMYGYLWTRLDAPLDAGPHPVITAAGHGSQFIHVVPALETVIVITGGNHLNGKTFAPDPVLLRELVPGIER